MLVSTDNTTAICHGSIQYPIFRCIPSDQPFLFYWLQIQNLSRYGFLFAYKNRSVQLFDLNPAAHADRRWAIVADHLRYQPAAGQAALTGCDGPRGATEQQHYQQCHPRHLRLRRRFLHPAPIPSGALACTTPHPSLKAHGDHMVNSHTIWSMTIRYVQYVLN